uniref:Uncharacterized protein n=1 Tax=Anguilla anguilla TaxID=7936 RepID=A0A0E9RR87_ANGAN
MDFLGIKCYFFLFVFISSVFISEQTKEGKYNRCLITKKVPFGTYIHVLATSHVRRNILRKD